LTIQEEDFSSREVGGSSQARETRKGLLLQGVCWWTKSGEGKSEDASERER